MCATEASIPRTLSFKVIRLEAWVVVAAGNNVTDNSVDLIKVDSDYGI